MRLSLPPTLDQLGASSQGAKLQPQAVQSSASVHDRTDSTSGWLSHGAHVAYNRIPWTATTDQNLKPTSLSKDFFG